MSNVLITVLTFGNSVALYTKLRSFLIFIVQYSCAVSLFSILFCTIGLSRVKLLPKFFNFHSPRIVVLSDLIYFSNKKQILVMKGNSSKYRGVQQLKWSSLLYIFSRLMNKYIFLIAGAWCLC